MLASPLLDSFVDLAIIAALSKAHSSFLLSILPVLKKTAPQMMMEPVIVQPIWFCYHSK